MKIMLSNELISVSANATINQRAKLVLEKLQCAYFVHNPPTITAVMQNHGDPDSVIFSQPYS